MNCPSTQIELGRGHYWRDHSKGLAVSSDADEAVEMTESPESRRLEHVSDYLYETEINECTLAIISPCRPRLWPCDIRPSWSRIPSSSWRHPLQSLDR
jgi:hypothetical protein